MRIRPLLLAALLCASTGSAIAQTATTDAEATPHRMLDQLDAGDYAAVTATFYPQMTAALSADALRQVQTQIEAAGPVTSRDAPRGTQLQGMTVVVTRVHRAQASLMRPSRSTPKVAWPACTSRRSPRHPDGRYRRR
ncbi:hypothetical protein [Luteimonas terrae]|uniref:DUF4440 domain-containing protein n=1 Tax=Luteimonas terrae TaxID=1530191 RepID=A0ABU1XWF7_9GAMM|nr:hypothetical protein [Luteimonas terrae]MDR7193090.1 hypothetical protein [Luteimonas terrae]